MRVLANHRKLLAVIVVLVFIIILLFEVPRNQLLTNDEISTLITERGINAISTNDIGDSYTVIVYRDGKSNEMLELFAYKNRWGKIITKKYAFYESGRIDKVDVEYWGTNPFSYNLDGYVGIEILSKDILDQARSAELILDNGLVIRAKFQGSNILLIQAKRNYFWEKPKLKTIEILDDEGNVLHGFYS